jgi:hypothetical protein
MYSGVAKIEGVASDLGTAVGVIQIRAGGFGAEDASFANTSSITYLFRLTYRSMSAKSTHLPLSSNSEALLIVLRSGFLRTIALISTSLCFSNPHFGESILVHLHPAPCQRRV